MRSIGLHMRIMSSLIETAQQARDAGLRTFQCFLLNQTTGSYLELSDDDYHEFLQFRQQHFDTLYIHASYWINLASRKTEGAQNILLKELTMGARLGFNYVIIHPGQWGDWSSQGEGIDCIARILNEVTRRKLEISIILENVAFGEPAIGGDLNDFILIQSRLENPEQIFFCIDSSHAFAFGYNLANNKDLQEFVVLLKKIFHNKIALLHINNTKELCGSRRDKHSLLDDGEISLATLKKFILHKDLINIPAIMELPLIPLDEQMKYVSLVRSWH